jgi:hypothetical protein
MNSPTWIAGKEELSNVREYLEGGAECNDQLPIGR